MRFLLVLWRFLRPWGVIRVTSVFGVRPSPEPACRDGTEDAARRVSSRFKKTDKEAKRRARDTMAAAGSTKIEANALRARATLRAMDAAAAE